MKVCSTCKIKKPVSEFYKNKQGLEYQCKSCKKEYQKKYNQAHKIEIAGYQRGYSQSPAGKEARRKNDKKRSQKFPEKIKAVSIINNAITLGKLQRSVFCERCGLPAKTEGHHSDYNEPLDVEWLCTKCHRKLHQREVV